MYVQIANIIDGPLKSRTIYTENGAEEKLDELKKQLQEWESILLDYSFDVRIPIGYDIQIPFGYEGIDLKTYPYCVFLCFTNCIFLFLSVLMFSFYRTWIEFMQGSNFGN